MYLWELPDEEFEEALELLIFEVTDTETVKYWTKNEKELAE